MRFLQPIINQSSAVKERNPGNQSLSSESRETCLTRDLC